MQAVRYFYLIVLSQIKLAITIFYFSFATYVLGVAILSYIIEEKQRIMECYRVLKPYYISDFAIPKTTLIF